MKEDMAETAVDDRAEVRSRGSSDFEEFFRAEHHRLLRASFLLTGGADEAKDIAQEAFLRIWERWDRVASMADRTGYLYRVALNEHRSRYRRLMGGQGDDQTRRPECDAGGSALGS